MPLEPEVMCIQLALLADVQGQVLFGVVKVILSEPPFKVQALLVAERLYVPDAHTDGPVPFLSHIDP